MKESDKRLARELWVLWMATVAWAVAFDQQARAWVKEIGHTVSKHVASSLGSAVGNIKSWLHPVDPNGTPDNKLYSIPQKYSSPHIIRCVVF